MVSYQNLFVFCVANKDLQHSSTYKKCLKKLLQQEVINKRKRFKVLEKELKSIKERLLLNLNVFDFNHVCNLFLVKNDKSLSYHQGIHNKKLASLSKTEIVSEHDPKKVIMNFSNYSLSEDEERLLSKGLQFAINPKEIEYSDFMMPFELLYRDLKSFDGKNDKLKNVKHKLLDTASSSYNNMKQNKIESNLSKNESIALNKLISEKDIVIQKSDKGNSVVILDKKSYLDKMKGIISDESKFEVIEIDENKYLNFVLNSQDKIKNVIKKIKDKGNLSLSDYERISPVGTRPGILYGLPKVHKPVINNIPSFRPILSAINTPSYKLAKYLVPILSSLTFNEFTVKDTFHFVKDIAELDSKTFMASLDVESLFTNIPLNETINNLVNDMFLNQDIVNTFNKRDMFELLSIATKESFFIFDEKIYRQIDGVSMGSPLGPTLANAFLCHYEKEWLDSCPAEFKPLIYKRYVDDIFVLFSCESHVQKFTDYMNNRHKSIRFTNEVEKNNQFAFLDVLISRKTNLNKFETSIYRKSTFSGVFTNFNSFIPSIYKHGLIHTMLFRTFSICSSYEKFHQEIVKLKDIFKKNAYPENVIDRCIKSFLNKIFNPRKTELLAPKKEILIMLPFIGKESFEIRNRINSCLRKNFPVIDLKVVFQTKIRLSNLFNYKDKISKDLQSNLVYKFSCNICNDIYYGKTIRHFKVRSCEHLGLTPLTGKRVKTPKEGAILDHIIHSGHTPSFDDFSILVKDSNEFRLLIRESLLISRDNPSLNRNIQSIPLELFS